MTTDERRCSSCGGLIGPNGHLCMGGRDLSGHVRGIRWNCAACGQSGPGLGSDHACPGKIDDRIRPPAALYAGPVEWTGPVMCYLCGRRPGTKTITVDTPARPATARICPACELDLVRGGPWLPCRVN